MIEAHKQGTKKNFSTNLQPLEIFFVSSSLSPFQRKKKVSVGKRAFCFTSNHRFVKSIFLFESMAECLHVVLNKYHLPSNMNIDCFSTDICHATNIYQVLGFCDPSTNILSRTLFNRLSRECDRDRS